MVHASRIGNGHGRASLALVLAAVLLVEASLGGMAYGAGQEGRETVVRKVDSPPPLSEMDREPGWSYNAEYLFSVSRAVRDSTLPPAGKVPLFIPAMVVDIALFPFALIAGLLGE